MGQPDLTNSHRTGSAGIRRQPGRASPRFGIHAPIQSSHGTARQECGSQCSRHVVARCGGLIASFGRCAAASRSAPHAAALECVTETSAVAVGHVAAVAAPVEYAVAVAAAVEHAAVLVAENVAVVAGCALVAAVVGHVAAVAAALEHDAVLAAENVAVVLVSVGFVYRRVGPAVHRHEQQLQEAKTKRKY